MINPLLPVLPLRDIVVFPHMVAPLFVGRKQSVNALNSVMAGEKKIFLLEDCSQAVGAKINGQKTGTFGDISAFSIMYRKNLAANSSGGIVFTKKLKLHHKSLAYGDRGKILWKENLDFRDPKYSLFPALNWNTDEFSCAIGYANLKRLDNPSGPNLSITRPSIFFQK